MPKAYMADASKMQTAAELEVAPLEIVEEHKPNVKFDMLRSEEPAQEAAQYQESAESKIDTSWLPWAAKTYNISPNLEDYVVKSMPLCPADLPNRNGIGFQLAELLKYQPPPIARQVYKAWTGCPVHYEHKNEIHTDALGVIFDTSLRLVRTHGNGKLYMVHGLIGVDKKKYPKHASRLMSGDLNTGSMGALADAFTCAVCGKEAKEETFMNCNHISSTSKVNWGIVNHEGLDKLAFLWAHSLSPIEYSLVESPAWTQCMAPGTL
jgi:hypothetical protein